MDIGGKQIGIIKKHLSDNPGGVPASSLVTDALLHIIEQLENAQDIQVARLEPGDVVVINVPFELTDSMRYQIKADSAELFPGHKTLVLEAGMTLSAMRFVLRVERNASTAWSMTRSCSEV